MHHKNLTFVELFCGSAKSTMVFQNAGFKTWNTDRRNRAGKCEPNHQADLFDVSRSNIPFNSVNVLWASIPCEPYSYAAGNFYWADKLPTKSAVENIELLDYTLKLIAEICPDLYFIENPRGHLRYQKLMVDFLVKSGGMIKPISMGSYGFPSTKPTDIFTNALKWQPLPMLPFGRGAKNANDFNFSNLTVCQRQATPVMLAESVKDFCVQHFENSYESKMQEIAWRLPGACEAF